MGVTLERVQNKFACIIGELCSEPVVLSQFAIWLDLRLAEYKAKGAISLECSGQDPDPTWLKGHNFRQGLAKHVKEKEEFPGRASSFAPRSSFGTPPSDSRSNSALCTNIARESDRLHTPDDVVVVKDEPVDSDDHPIFPVTLHKHEHFNINRTPRKRSVAETVTGEDNSPHSDNSILRQQSPAFLSQSPKIRRVALSTDIIAEPVSNQSLMEIISGDLQDPNNESDSILDDISVIDNGAHGGSRGENSFHTFSSQPIASTSHGANDSFSSFREGQDTGSNHSNSGMTDHGCTVISGIGESQIDESLQSTTGSSAYLGQSMKPKILGEPDPHLHPKTYPENLSNQSIRIRIAGLEAKPHRTIQSIVATIAMLERWMWNKYGEKRKIEDMPPAVLDKYLAEFYSIARKPDGSEYDPAHLSKFRSYLERFLKELHYPCSIKSSPEFALSKRAYAYYGQLSR